VLHIILFIYVFFLVNVLLLFLLLVITFFIWSVCSLYTLVLYMLSVQIDFIAFNTREYNDNNVLWHLNNKYYYLLLLLIIIIIIIFILLLLGLFEEVAARCRSSRCRSLWYNKLVRLMFNFFLSLRGRLVKDTKSASRFRCMYF